MAHTVETHQDRGAGYEKSRKFGETKINKPSQRGGVTNMGRKSSFLDACRLPLPGFTLKFKSVGKIQNSWKSSSPPQKRHVAQLDTAFLQLLSNQSPKTSMVPCTYCHFCNTSHDHSGWGVQKKNQQLSGSGSNSSFSFPDLLCFCKTASNNPIAAFQHDLLNTSAC